MKKATVSITFLLEVAILVLCLLLISCGGDSSKTASASAGLAAPETMVGFPIYSNALLSMMIHVVDGEIVERERIVKALAQLPQVRRGDWEGMKKMITAFQESWGDAGIYWFALPDGRYYTVEKGLTDQNLRDRPYFPELLAGRAVVGELVVSKSTGKKSTVTAIPIFSDKKQISGALGTTLFLEKLDETLASSLSLPEGAFFYALGKGGITVLHQKLGMVFDNPLAKDSPTLKAATEKMLSTESGEVQYEFTGFKKQVRYQASPLTGWRFAVGINIAKL